ncbi:MAG: hypothetical protein OEW89_03570 [Gammaproteobacteria bacterium]|nr:hypothetical protein [Gammaproteobacteria bacterium]
MKMKKYDQIKLSARYMVNFVLLLISSVSIAATSSDFAAEPPIINQTATPIVMLNVSNDHQLFYKAYTDYDDLDGDGSLDDDKTYNDTVDYYGYFDPEKCYTYSTSSGGEFNPAGTATGTNNHHCDGTASSWSGNFLNWISMSRMDILRKVLYGGKRSTDTISKTVLERAYIPSDAHAWAKYYANAGNDINKYTPYLSVNYPDGLTFCNVTTPNGADSKNNTNPPSMRVGKGEWANWDSQEGEQCLWDNEQASSSSPNTGNAAQYVGEFTIRVEVCNASYLGTESCKIYFDSGTNRYKPTGLLQTYAESDTIHFGLMTGSYSKGKSGGVLRKNISTITDEINQTNGKFTNTDGIISTLNALRISTYKSGAPPTGYNIYDSCNYGQNSWLNDDCVNWGNPIGEMYLESLRYLTGAAASASYSATDSTYISTLTTATWKDPYIAIASGGLGYPSCSAPNIINFSSGSISFDDDEYGGASDITGLNITTETNAIGTLEGINGNQYYVGSTTGGSASDTCSSTTVNTLDSVSGLCPDAAGLEGSYKIAGMSYFAHKNDIRSTISGSQIVDTFSVSLASPRPELSVNVGSNTVKIIPVGYNWRDENDMPIVNFKVISHTATTGEFFMNFENAPAGADHDSDFKGYLKYEVIGSNISITAYNTGSSAGATMHMGYIIDGVTDAGTYYLASNRDSATNTQQADGLGGDYTTTQAAINASCGAVVYPASGSETSCATVNFFLDGITRDLRGVRTHGAGASTTALLESPLWYAAKYGGFADSDGDNQPDITSEWDALNNNTGGAGADGIPDNYFLVTNASNLENRLKQIFNAISERVSSGTAAAVVSNNSSGVGAIYQALYQPLVTGSSNDITWVGFLHSIFIDDKGLFREDSNANDQLDGYTTDYRLIFSYDSANDKTVVQRQSSADNGVTFTNVGSTVDLINIVPIWNAQDQLAGLTTYTANRSNYTDNASSGRWIKTWVDGANGGTINSTVEDAEIIAFTKDNFCNYSGGACTASLYRHLEVTDVNADNVVDFIRGEEGITGYRPRSLDTDGNGSVDTYYLLGDIIHSTPVVVGEPAEGYDTTYGDTTYKEFREYYKNRRQMIYLGANDGMVHAFNGGFWNAASKRFDTTSGTNTAHNLGAELWSYIPMNLLPHLRWLTEINYPHVYYMDGAPLVFDANIFTPGVDTNGINHVKGWGTIMVIGMRLGGGSITYDADGDGTNDTTSRSAYVIFDVTDPEKEPHVIAEITNANLGFTTSKPSVVRKRVPDGSGNWETPDADDWYLVFGSGPTDLTTVTAPLQGARLYKYNLNTKAFETGFDGTANITGDAATASFTGDMKTVDWNNDFIDDAVYFGTVSGSVSSPTGTLERLRLELNTFSTLFDPNQAITSAVSTGTDEDGDDWVFFGTGRMFVSGDASSTVQQDFYGIKEPESGGAFTWATVLTTDLLDVSGVQTFNDSSILDTGGSLAASGLSPVPTTASELEQEIEDNWKGWKLDLIYDGTNPSSRNVTTSTRISSLLLFSDYLPSSNECDTEGSSDLYAVNYKTGTATTFGALGFDSTISNSPGTELSNISIDLGAGLVSPPVVHSGTGYGASGGASGGGAGPCGPGTVSVIVQSSTGELTSKCVAIGSFPSGRQSWQELDL